MLSIIVAKAKNNIIGKDNGLIWYLPEDLKRFKKLTEGHTIIMGRKTFESLGRILPNRKHIVFSRNPEFKIEHKQVEVVNSITEISQYIESEEEVFVIGGAMIYSMLLPYATKIYVTQINKEFEGDTFFPRIAQDKWEIIDIQKGLRDKESKLDYEYITYKRINKI